MTDAAERHGRAKELFTAALDRDRATRLDWLRGQCDADGDLFRQVAALLEYAESDSDFLRTVDHVDGAGVALADDDLPAGARFGNYELVRKIAAGGMGTVYEAEQLSPRRRVALKVVRAGVATATGLRRFELEAELLGRLRHPAIAQIHEAGSVGEGALRRPFLAMELVEGEPVDRYVRTHGIGPRGVAALVAEVCEGVEHAHQRRVVHRDLKPSNVLVEPGGRPRIVDFGIGRELGRGADEADALTVEGQVVGTLAYMSPEQATGRPEDVGTPTDVYSLGAMAYELVTGASPFDVSEVPLFEALRRLREVEPPRPSARCPSLDADLEAVIAKAMAKDLGQRYASAAELGADLRRYLADEPIAARPPSAVYQLRKFARRHKALVSAAAFAALALVAGTVATSWQAARAERARADAELRLGEARAIQSFLLDVVRSARPFQLGRDVTVREAIADAEQRIAASFADRPRLEASVRHTLGDTLNHLGEWQRAADNLRRALALCEEPQDAGLAARVRFSLGRTLFELGDYEESERMASAAAQALRAEGAADTALASALLNLASLLERRGSFGRAERLGREAIAMFESIEGGNPEHVAIAHSNLTGVLRGAGDIDGARRSAEHAIAIMRRHGRTDGANFARMCNQLARTLSTQGHHREAVVWGRQALELADEHLGPEHGDRHLIATTLAEDLCSAGEVDEGLALARSALAARRSLFDPGHPHLLHGETILGRALLAAGRAEQARQLLDRVVTELDERGASDDRLAPGARLAYVRALSATGAFEEAVAAAERLLDGLAAVPDGHWLRGVCRREHARALRGAGRTADAAAEARRALAILEASLGPAHPHTREAAALLRAQ